MNREQVFSLIRAHLVDELEVSPSSISESTRFREDLEADSGRWPSFSAAALREGFQSVSALPLRFRDVTLGALNLFSVMQAPMARR